MEPGKKRVVIVGGGIAGSLVAKNLQDHSDVYLIDPKEYTEITYATLRCMVEPSFAERSLINHSEYAPNARIIKSAAVNIAEHDVTTAQGDVVGYDYLVIATGHDDQTASTKTEKISLYKSDQEKIKSSNSVLIIGGGPTGVELAAEIATDFPDKKVTLVHRGTRIIDFAGEKASRSALRWLTKRNVEVIMGESVDLSSESNGIYQTSGGKTVQADSHFLCITKPLASSWLKETILQSSLDDRGRLMVDAEMRVSGHNNIFAIGDITNIKEMKQGYLAQMHSEVVSKNIKSLMKGKDKLEVYKGGPQVALVSLGRREAVAQISSITMCGRIPGMMKSRDLFVGKARKTLGLSAMPRST